MKEYDFGSILAQFLIVDEFVRKSEIAKHFYPQRTIGEIVEEIEQEIHSEFTLFSPGFWVASLYFAFVCIKEQDVIRGMDGDAGSIGVTGEYENCDLKYFCRKMRNAVAHYNIEILKDNMIRFYDTYTDKKTGKVKTNFDYSCSYNELYNVSYNLLLTFASSYRSDKSELN